MLLALISYSTYTVSWPALPIGDNPLTLLTGPEQCVRRRSRILSSRVGIFKTYVKQCSFEVSKSCSWVARFCTPGGTCILHLLGHFGLSWPFPKRCSTVQGIQGQFCWEDDKKSQDTTSYIFNLHHAISQSVSNSGVSVQSRSRLKAIKTPPCASPTLSFRIASKGSGKISEIWGTIWR